MKVIASARNPNYMYGIAGSNQIHEYVYTPESYRGYFIYQYGCIFDIVLDSVVEGSYCSVSSCKRSIDKLWREL